MVLFELGTSISRALRRMSNETIIDECLNKITCALLKSDVKFKLVHNMQTNIKKIVNLDNLITGQNKSKIIQQVCRFWVAGDGLVSSWLRAKRWGLWLRAARWDSRLRVYWVCCDGGLGLIIGGLRAARWGSWLRVCCDGGLGLIFGGLRAARWGSWLRVCCDGGLG
ncbi:signal recognition particle 54 kDa protein 2-like [Fagus crenata]